MMKLFCLVFLGCSLMGCYSGNSKDGCSKEKLDNSSDPLVKIVDTNFIAKGAVYDSIGTLERSLIAAGLVDVKSQLPGVFVELKYSTTDNFFGKDVYGDLTRCYLQKEVVQKLKLALENLQDKYPELTFLIYDGVRPNSVQQILWDGLDKPDSIKPLYVADPKKGSLHNYGVAVDLTIADKVSGKALDLGTHYDYFGYAAYPEREEQMLRVGKITDEQINNRNILRDAMQSAGFTGIGSEWWHFNAYSLSEAKKKFTIIK